MKATKTREAVTIRLATAEDLEPLVRMYVSFEPKLEFQGLPPANEERIRRWLEPLLRAPNSHLIIETDTGRIVGHAMLCQQSSERAELAIFVHQDYRHHGLGEKLMQAIVRFACQCLHLRKIWLTVELLNAPAVNLYQKLGFVPIYEQGVLSSELIMEREVSCQVCRQQQCPVFEAHIPLRIEL
ncbi:MAG: GNAT family N-acetyltransferase [Acidobacteriota bacterium]|nr:GNAT family N-acetyltransferase [Blastocatellia bacterium]MDW8240932.1 GNAT family N-acetyltransferase [Acidobacteriota bacterium]